MPRWLRRDDPLKDQLNEIDRLLDLHGVYTSLDALANTSFFVQLRGLTGATLFLKDALLHNLLIQRAPNVGNNIINVKVIHAQEYTCKKMGIRPQREVPQFSLNDPSIRAFKKNLAAGETIFCALNQVHYLPIQWYWPPRHYGLLQCLVQEKDPLAMQIFTKSITTRDLQGA